MSCIFIDHTHKQTRQFVIFPRNSTTIFTVVKERVCENYFQKLPFETYITCDGKIVSEDDLVCVDKVYHLVPCLVGGKGGFGSMLRAIGAQIEKTTNHEACRDISGRRMRDVNNEKQLKEWITKKAQKEKEREQQRQERIARRRAMPNHKFDDPNYEKQRALVAENQEDALQKGLMKAKPSSTVTSETETSSGENRKRPAASSSAGPSSKVKKETEWLGIDIDNLSDLDSEDEQEEDIDSNKEDGVNDIKDSDIPNKSDDSDSVNDAGDSDIPNGNSNNDSKNIIQDDLYEQNKEQESSSNSEDLQQRGDNLAVIGGRSCLSSDGEKTTTQKHGLLTALDEINKKPEKVPDVTEIELGPINLDEINSVSELEILGLDTLKSELMNRGLKCGGSCKERAERLLSVKGLTKEQIDPSLFAKSANGKGVKNKK